MNLQNLALSAVRQLSRQPRITDWLGRNTSWDNPFTEERARYPYAHFETERENGAVYWHKLYNNWVVLGYDECQQVLASQDFSSGVAMEQLLELHPYSKLSPAGLDFVRNLLIFMDGDTHRRLRSLVSRAFTPRSIAALEPRIHDIAAGLLSAPPRDESVDVFAAFTSQLPVCIIGELLGVPEARWEWLQAVTTEMTKLLDPIRGFDPAEMDTALLELRGYIMALADTRRQSPTDDLISALIQVEDSGDRLGMDELVWLVGTLLFGGSETTTGLMGNAIVNLMRYPDQRAALIGQPELWPNAIEEFLRYDPAVMFAPRTATQDTMIAGHPVKAGQLVEVMIAAANRDPRRYHRPGVLQLDRENPSPLSFGHGIHYCVGAALARTTARIGLQTFLDAFGNYNVDLDAVTWRTSATLRGPVSLPVTREPA